MATRNEAEELELHGIVLSSAPVRDFDKRLTVLSKEYGKTTVWASGAKRPGSALMAASRNFVFGTFVVRKGRNGYNLARVRVSQYFDEIALDLVNACYGSYILEFASYMAQEDLPAEEMLMLVYLALKGILNEKLPNDLVRRIYELKMMMLNGEYTEQPPYACSPSCAYAWQFVLTTPVNRLFTFTLTPEVQKEFSDCVDYNLHRFAPWEFKSLDILKALG